ATGLVATAMVLGVTKVGASGPSAASTAISFSVHDGSYGNNGGTVPIPTAAGWNGSSQTDIADNGDFAVTGLSFNSILTIYGGVWNGHVDLATGAMNVDGLAKIAIGQLVGTTSVGCDVGPSQVHFTTGTSGSAHGAAYNFGTGQATLVENVVTFGAAQVSAPS